MNFVLDDVSSDIYVLHILLTSHFLLEMYLLLDCRSYRYIYHINLRSHLCCYLFAGFCFVGLCRTCEIFGASVLVLDSLHHVRDKHFQSLSVSSELWLPLMEVN